MDVSAVTKGGKYPKGGGKGKGKDTPGKGGQTTTPKAPGKGSRWCTNCRSSTHDTAYCWTTMKGKGKEK